MARKIKRFTQFDAMEERGDFEANPANPISSGYQGPVEFPRLVYAAEEEVIQAGSYDEVKGRGVLLLGEVRALRNREVRSREELADALADGWYDHPAKALRAVIEATPGDRRKVPPISAQETIDSYERKIAELEGKLAEAKEERKPMKRAAFAPPRVDATV
jgi:hypothetical protein